MRRKNSICIPNSRPMLSYFYDKRRKSIPSHPISSRAKITSPLTLKSPSINISRPIILPIRSRRFRHAIRAWCRSSIITLLSTRRRSIHSLRCRRAPISSPARSWRWCSAGSRGVVRSGCRSRVCSWSWGVHSCRSRSRHIDTGSRRIVRIRAPAVVGGWLIGAPVVV